MSAAMLDSFDSPMLDYHNDHDIPMQNNSDPWYHGEEHIMEDAGHDDGSHGSIEVDMEGFEEDGNPEYEMVDTEEVYGNQTHESIEMEMYEASHNPSPYHRSLAITEDDTQAPNTATVDFNETSKLSTPLLLSPKPILEEHTMAASPLPFSDDVERTFIPAAQPDLPLPIVIPVTADFNETVDQRGTSLPSVEDDQQLRPPVPEVDAAAASNLPPVVVVDEVPEGAIHPVRVTSSNEDNLGEHTGDDYPSQAESHAHQDDKDDEVPSTSIGAGNEDAITLSQKTHLDGEHYQEQEQEEDEEDVHHEHTSSAASSGDPHEISEGVYIDPPPPVLMSFPAEASSVTLFNLASDSSGTLAPSEPTLLLVHQPTLYYEPLSSVFEALRQEEYIQSVPGLLDGELVLNAFDLELILSEDHTFSQEVTLHDLNVLHDGLRKAGPLRVQLKRVGPRFLDRYHALQQEVERLELFNGQPPNHVQASNEDQAEHGQDIAHISSTNQPQTELGHLQAEAVSDHEQHEHDNDLAKLEAYEEAVPPPPEDDDEDGEEDEEQAAELEQTDLPPQSHPLPQTSVEEENKTEDIEQNTYGVEVPTDLPEEQNMAAPAPPTSLNNEPREQSQPEDDPPRAEAIPNLSESVQPPNNRPKDREDLSRSDHTDELFEEFEEFHEDDESGTLSDPGASEHASVDHTAASFHEEYNDQDWEASFAGNDNSAEAKHQEFLLEEPIKLQRVQSFGSSKRSISEAELEDFDDGDTTLTGSPGSKRLKKE